MHKAEFALSSCSQTSGLSSRAIKQSTVFDASHLQKVLGKLRQDDSRKLATLSAGEERFCVVNSTIKL